MKLSVDLTLAYISVSFVLGFISVVSSQSFMYEKMQNHGVKHPVIPNYRRFLNYKQHPEPLPSTTLSPIFLRSPFNNIYQGARKPNDTRVYRRRFEYEAQVTGHHVICKGLFDCIITHLAIETNGGIPILLRGGAGYPYFVVVAKARPGDELKGSVRAYCLKKPDKYYQDFSPVTNHSFKFE